jgi:3-deoxy-manno-octulosonate cytidylyltransferase (CMP-KDO synthetase)
VNHTGSNPQKIVVAVIPARFSSHRLPGKPLLEIDGRPMICWVAERASAAKYVSRVIVATDDQRVFEAVNQDGFEAMMTATDHLSGTDRLAEVASKLADAEILVNVQGDEPLISPETIDRAIKALLEDEGCLMASTWEPITNAADVLSPDVVKVALDDTEHALYFSRSPVPYPREAVRQHGSIEAALESDPGLLTQFRKHTGLYVYRRQFLLEFAGWPQSTLEQLESLEQLRALAHGIRIKVVEGVGVSIGVDTAEDLERVREMISASHQSPGLAFVRPAEEMRSAELKR